MSEENGKLRQQLARREEEVKRISTEAEAQQTAEWTRIQGELETLHAKFATANRNNTDLRQTLQNTESRYEEQLLRLDAELSKSRSELASMAKPVPDRSAVEVQELRAKNDAMAKQFQEMVVANQQTVRGLEAELGQAQTQAIEARKQVDDLQEQLGADASVAGVSLVGLGDESLRLQVEELQRDKAAALRNFADSKNKLEEATAMLTKSEQQIGALRAQIDSAPNLEKLNGQIQDLTQSLQAAILSKATAERRATLGDDTIRKLQEDKANSVAGLQADVRAATDKAGALGRQLSEVTANSAGQIAILQQKLEQASARAASAETSLASTSASLASAQEANLRLNMQGGGKSAGADSALMRENAALKAELAQEKYNNSKTQVVNALIQSMRRDHHIAISPHKHTILVDKFAQALDDQYEDPASRAKFAAESAGKGAENLARGMLSKMKEEGVFRDSKSVGEDGVYNVAMFTLRRAYNLLSGDQYMSLNTGKLNEALSAAVQEARKAISPSNSSGSLHTIGSLSSASTESLIRGQGGRE